MASLRTCIGLGTKAHRNERPEFSKWPEVMCFQADPSTPLAMYAMKELRDAGRLKLLSVQKSYVIGIEGTKGKQSFGKSSNSSIAAFGRTATHVFRLVMLEACGVDPDHWPQGGESSFRNEDKLKYEQIYGHKFILADSYEEAREYWSEFDKQYPHFLIEKVLEEKTGSLNSVMLIFKNYMQEVVEITTNVCVGLCSGKKIDSSIVCTVVHRSIDLKGATGKWLNRLAMVVRGSRCPLETHFNMMLDLEIDSTTTPQTLDDALSILYENLPNTVSEIDDSSTCVKPVAATLIQQQLLSTGSTARDIPKDELEVINEQQTVVRSPSEEDQYYNSNIIETKTVKTEKTVTITKVREIPSKSKKSPKDNQQLVKQEVTEKTVVEEDSDIKKQPVSKKKKPQEKNLRKEEDQPNTKLENKTKVKDQKDEEEEEEIAEKTVRIKTEPEDLLD